MNISVDSVLSTTVVWICCWLALLASSGAPRIVTLDEGDIRGLSSAVVYPNRDDLADISPTEAIVIFVPSGHFNVHEGRRVEVYRSYNNLTATIILVVGDR